MGVCRKLVLTLLLAQLAGSVCLARAEGLVPRVLLGGCEEVVVDAAETRALAADATGRLVEWDVASGAFLRELPAVGATRKMAYLSDGSLAVQRANGAIGRYDAGLHPAASVIAEPLKYRDFESARQALVVAALARDHASVAILDVSGKTPVVAMTLQAPSGLDIASFSLSPAGDALAVVDEMGAAFVFDTRTGEVSAVGAGFKAVGITLIGRTSVFLWLDNSFMPGSQEYRYRDGRWMQAGELYFGVPADVHDATRPILMQAGAGLGFAALLAARPAGAAPLKRATLWTLPISPTLRQIRWLANSETLLSCARNLTRWAPQTNKVHWTTEAEPNAVTIDYLTRNGQFAVLADDEGRTAVWSIGQSTFRREFPPMVRLVFPSISSLSEDGDVYAAFGMAGTVTLFRARGEALRVDSMMLPDQSSAVWENSILYSEKQREFLIKSSQQVRRIPRTEIDYTGDARPESYQLLQAEDVACTSFAGREAISASARFASFACGDNAIVILELATGRVARVALHQKQIDRLHNQFISAQQFIGDDQIVVVIRRDLSSGRDALDRVAAAGSADIYVVDRASQAVRKLPADHREPITDLAIDNKRGILYAASFFGTITAIDLASGRVQRRIEGVASPILGMSLDTATGELFVSNGTGVLRKIPSGGKHAGIAAVFLEGGHFAAWRAGEPVFVSYPGVVDRLGLADAEFAVLPPQSHDGHRATPIRWRASAPGARPGWLDGFAVAERAGEFLLTTTPALPRRAGDRLLVFVNHRLVTVVDDRGARDLPMPALEDGDVVELVQFSGEHGYGPLLHYAHASKPGTGRIAGAFVGISNYDTLPQLAYARNDAVAVAGAFARATQASPAYLKTLPEGQRKTARAVEAFLREAALATGPADTFILFLSGHGGRSEGQFHIAAEDARVDPARVSGVIRSEALMDIIRIAKARNILVIIDACEGGGFNADWNSRYIASGLSSFFGMRRAPLNKSVYVAAAAPPFLQARETAGNGEFSKVVLEAIEKAGSRDEEPLTAHGLLDYLARNAPARFRKNFYLDVVPVTSFGVRDFTVWERKK